MTAHEAWTEDLLERLAVDTGATVTTDRASCDAAAQDFSRLVRGSSRAVIQPRSAEEVSRVLRFASARGLRVTPRGRGFSGSGQSIARSGATLDLTRLDRVQGVAADGATITCEAGASWRAVVAASAPSRRLPCALPLNLDMTVGGLLAAGGIGDSSHRYGATVAAAVELEVVTGDGRKVRCSAESERRLYEATLAGQGRCGVIVSATLALRPVPARVSEFLLAYDALEPWLADQRALARDPRCDHLEGFCWMAAKGLRTGPHGRRPFAQWLYGLAMGVEHDEGGAPAARSLLADLHHSRVVHVDEDDPVRFAGRYQGRYDFMHRSGTWLQCHPWLECFVAPEALAALLPELLDALPPALGDGHRCFPVSRRNAPPFLALPPGEDVLCFAILPVGVPPLLWQDCLAALKGVNQTLLAAGAKRYLSGWLGHLDRNAWRAHFGERYDDWIAAKREFDPYLTLESLLFPPAE